MNKIKHKPPSRIKYEKNNPVFSLRMPKEWHEEMEVLLENTNQSRKDFLAVSLGKQTTNYERLKNKWDDEGFNRGYQNGHSEGVAEGMNKCTIKCYCYVCGREVDIAPNSDAWKSITNFSKTHHMFDCSECTKNNFD